MAGRTKQGNMDSAADEVADVSRYGADGGNGTMGGYNRNDASMLSADEQDALHRKEVKVVNPWIHEATHKEYLENVKVSSHSKINL
jgi:hypothetical protein